MKIEPFTTGKVNPRYIVVYNTWRAAGWLIVHMKHLKPKDRWPKDDNIVARFTVKYHYK